MKKVLGTLAVAAVLVAAFPMTASAGNVKPGCGGIFFRPCPATRPGAPASNPNGTSRGGSTSTGTGTGNGTSNRGAGGGRTGLPPAPAR